MALGDTHGTRVPAPDQHPDLGHCCHPIPQEDAFLACCWCGKTGTAAGFPDGALLPDGSIKASDDATGGIVPAVEALP